MTGIAAGADAIDYGHYTSESPSSAAYDPSPFLPTDDVASGATRWAKEFKLIRPYLLFGDRVPAAATSQSIRLAAWKWNGKTLAVAVNTQSQSTRAKVSMPKVSGLVTVLGENRTLTIRSGQFVTFDHFAALGVHVYEVTG
jgi:hypothetical protein